MTPLDAALLYASFGWPVFPIHWPFANAAGVLLCSCSKRNKRSGPVCDYPAKHPRTRNGHLDATTTEQQVRTWWGPTTFPQANIGVDLARGGLVDIAPDNLAWHAEFLRLGLPDTLTFVSGGGVGHQHYLYRQTADCPHERICVEGEYDILSAGYAILPPSQHISGGFYSWVPGHEPPGWGV